MDELWQDSQPTTPSEPEGTDGLGIYRTSPT